LASRSTTGSDRSAQEQLRAIHGSIRGGDYPAALSRLQQLEHSARNDALLLQAVAECYTHCGKHRDAYRCHERAVQIAPGEAGCIYNLAASCVAIGRIDEAERLFSLVIEIRPDDFDAWQNRSTLRRQSEQRNHVDELVRMLAKVTPGSPGEVPLCYALSKELEDLGDHARSFANLRRGADARRRQLSYRVAMDLEAIGQICREFSADVLDAAPKATCEAGPIFVLGLPRSGTTLVDRILSSHSAVESLGEINDLPLALMHAAGAVSSKGDLIRRAARIDFKALEREYLRRIAGYGSQRAYVIDKTPMNFLYLGLIRLALPSAKIIHLRRDPLDSGYAMYKTLFRMGYPFSYDLEDLGRYYCAYHQLMEHWRTHLPAGFLDVDYESLVQDQLAVSRSILDWCGLAWEARCADFHMNDTPAATASAAQVREPIHNRSVGSSRRHERELEPFARILRTANVLPT
jgi:tetratricopeptide (TPR) repeat protein